MISIKYTSDVSDTIWQVCFTLRWAEHGCPIPRLPATGGWTSLADNPPHFFELAAYQLSAGW
jgi:hypothetical protein